MREINMPGKNRDWGYASYYEDEDGKTHLIYTSIEKDGQVNRYKDNGDGGHGHEHWEKKEDFDAGKDSDWGRSESNDKENPDTDEVQSNGGCYLTTACMHQYKQNFDDNCHELMVLRWFRDNFVSLPDRFHYYKVAPKIVERINQDIENSNKAIVVKTAGKEQITTDNLNLENEIKNLSSSKEKK